MDDKLVISQQLTIALDKGESREIFMPRSIPGSIKDPDLRFSAYCPIRKPEISATGWQNPPAPS